MNTSSNIIQLVVCDMAGTTVTDNHEVEYCFSLAARKTGLRITDAEILSVQGWAKRRVFEVYWERQLGKKNDAWLDKVENSYTTFAQILENHYTENPVTTTEGTLALFAFLKERGIPIALTTGFYRKVTNIILHKLDWLKGLNKQYTGNGSGIIQASVVSDEVEHGRPEPDMILKAMQLLNVKEASNVINIGDTPSDIESGKKAGCRYSCCVTNGTHSAQQLAASGADLSFSSMLFFKQWLEGIL
jgi:phosphonatase-like hydrolase